MGKMARDGIINKYLLAMKAMNELSGTSDDVDVLLDKIIYMNHKYQGRPVTGNDTYPMPEDFNYTEFEKDYQEMINIEL